MNARAIFAVLWMLSCGVAGDISSTDFAGRASSGTSTRGGTGGGSGQPTPSTDAPPSMTNTTICGDGGVCNTGGVCCGATCCTINEICCSGRCLMPNVNQPTCAPF